MVIAERFPPQFHHCKMHLCLLWVQIDDTCCYVGSPRHEGVGTVSNEFRDVQINLRDANTADGVKAQQGFQVVRRLS